MVARNGVAGIPAALARAADCAKNNGVKDGDVRPLKNTELHPGGLLRN
jgi:hypothetical protein